MSRWALLAVLLLSVAGCSRSSRPRGGDGTVRDEPEPTPAVDLAAWQRAEMDIVQDAASVGSFAQRLANISKLAAAEAARAGNSAALWSGQPDAGQPTVNAGSGSAATGAWEMQFPRGNTVESYARILDYYGFELGLFQPDGKILYVYALSKVKPDTRTGAAAAENRYYLNWTRGDLAEADNELLSRAGIDAQDKVVLKFLRPEIASLLINLEKGHAAERASRVEKTRFGVRRKRDGYDFYVLEQTYKND